MVAEDFFKSWDEGMQDKYQHEDFKIESSGEITIDGRESYYAVYEFIYRHVMRKEKVYIIRGDSSLYRIRYTGQKNTFDENLEIFEKYVRSFKIKS